MRGKKISEIISKRENTNEIKYLVKTNVKKLDVVEVLVLVKVKLVDEVLKDKNQDQVLL